MLCLNCMKPFEAAYGVCPYCGYIPGTLPDEAYHLHPGTILHGRYIVGTTVGFGGFGITYRAWDRTLEKKVAIKEYYPNGIVNRVPAEKAVIIYSGSRADEFQNGKVRFLAEARHMARFNTHPHIVNVHEFFEENNTAYIVMEFLEGISYKQYIEDCGGRVDCGTAVGVAVSVLGALRELHKEKIIHRDVSPDNIFLVLDAPGASQYRVKLIDFGAARFSSGDEEKTLSIILKPGYAPPEQYRNKSKQGPWTDIYAVGAVLYCAITGERPEESVNRLVEDRLVPPSRFVKGLPQYLEDSILRAMALNQELRFQNVDQFQEALQNQTKVLSVKSELKRRKRIRGLGITGVCLAILGAFFICGGVYRQKQLALYRIQAQLSVQIPDVNGQKNEEIRNAGTMGGELEERNLMEREPSRDMMKEMLKEYRGKFEKVKVSMLVAQDWEGYPEDLARMASDGTLPEVFETSGISKEDKGLWGKLGKLEITYGTIDKSDYYFLEDKEFKSHFAKEKKQIPIAFRAPVLYVNTHMVPDTKELPNACGLERLQYEGVPSYCVSAKHREMYREAFQAPEGATEFQKADVGEKGYEPFLKREKAYYLGDTDDYEIVQASLGGIYEMVVLTKLQEEGKVKGQFTHFWSINGSLKGEEKAAADSLVFYLMGENAQDVFNLQNGNGLSLNKRMLKAYVESNREFQQVQEQLESLKMEYGEGYGL
ncbi:MAG: protein kinase [Lachnospiraceae bacterium]|nr:protein kinase [Lachnospiraceae bacterium]